MKDIQGMMKQAQVLQKKMQDTQNEINARVYIGEAGNGLVKVTMTGDGVLIKCVIDSSVLSSGEKDLVEDLIVAAHENVKSIIDNDSKETMDGALGGMNLPAGFKLPF